MHSKGKIKSTDEVKFLMSTCGFNRLMGTQKYKQGTEKIEMNPGHIGNRSVARKKNSILRVNGVFTA